MSRVRALQATRLVLVCHGQAPCHFAPPPSPPPPPLLQAVNLMPPAIFKSFQELCHSMSLLIHLQFGEGTPCFLRITASDSMRRLRS